MISFFAVLADYYDNFSARYNMTPLKMNCSDENKVRAEFLVDAEP